MARDGHTHASVVASSGLSPANPCRCVAPLTGMVSWKSVDCFVVATIIAISFKSVGSFLFLLPNAAQVNPLNSVEQLPLRNED